MKAEEIIAALRQRHRIPDWVFFEELRVGTGWARGADQRLDAWAIHCWPSKKHLRVAYEVKVSKADIKVEIANPAKRLAALALSNEFYFAIPADMDTPLLPAEAGLIVVDAKGAHVAREAPFRETPPPTWLFLASVARRAYLTAHNGGRNMLDYVAHLPAVKA